MQHETAQRKRDDEVMVMVRMREGTFGGKTGRFDCNTAPLGVTYRVLSKGMLGHAALGTEQSMLSFKNLEDQ